MLAEKSIDVRRGLALVSVHAEAIGAQRIERYQNDAARRLAGVGTGHERAADVDRGLAFPTDLVEPRDLRGRRHLEPDFACPCRHIEACFVPVAETFGRAIERGLQNLLRRAVLHEGDAQVDRERERIQGGHAVGEIDAGARRQIDVGGELQAAEPFGRGGFVANDAGLPIEFHARVARRAEGADAARRERGVGEILVHHPRGRSLAGGRAERQRGQ